MVVLAHPELVGRRVRGRQLTGRRRGASPSAAYPRSSSSRRGARTRPGRVDPAHEPAARRLDRPAHLNAAARQRECAPSGNSVTFARRSRCRSPATLSAPLPTHGVVTGPSLMRPIPASSQSPSSVQPVQPDPALRVLRAPVVARHPAPAVHVDRAPVHRERPGEARGRRRRHQLRARQPRAVHPPGRQVEQRLLGRLDARSHAGLVAGPARAVGEQRLADPEELAATGLRSGP